MSLPQIIHYCWFGEEMSQREQHCIATWKQFFSEYEIKFWNEKNIDFNECLYAKQAYEKKEYAFLSDYVRAKVLYEYGGIYLDTDVKLLKEFTVTNNNFVGFERKAFIGTAVIGCDKENPIIGELLNYYKTNPFLSDKGIPNRIANVSVLTDIFREKGLQLDGTRQKIAGFDIYERDYFYPKKLDKENFQITEKTEAVHLCNNSWMTERERKRGTNKVWVKIIRPTLRRFRTMGIFIIGKERVKKIEIKLRNRLR